ncbi:MAG TPA: hypothetical protein VFG07_06200 [Thermoplasmata archaeon]|nr:hypothetical protein [Thermoplasmata archaeon]
MIQCHSPIHPCGLSGWDTTLTTNTPVTWNIQVNGATVSTSADWSYAISSAGTYAVQSTMTDSLGGKFTTTNTFNIG